MTPLHLMTGENYANGTHFHRTFRPASAVADCRPTDAELVERAANGDESAFERIMRKNNRLLFRTARSILKSDAEAEDALQEAYLRAWRALSTFRADSKLSTWLVRIVINEALGRLRRRKSAQVIPLESVMESFDRQTQESIEEDDPNQSPIASDAIAGASTDGSPDRPASGSVPNCFHAARGRRISVEEVQPRWKFRGHRAHPFLSRSQPVARRPIARRRSW